MSGRGESLEERIEAARSRLAALRRAGGNAEPAELEALDRGLTEIRRAAAEQQARQDEVDATYRRDVAAHERAETDLRESQRFIAGILGALTTHVAVLDGKGDIIAVNTAWERFASSEQPGAPSIGLGSNYLSALDAAAQRGSEQAREVARAIREILAGERLHFALEISDSKAGKKRWRSLQVTAMGGRGPTRLVVSREDVTQRRQAEEALRHSMNRTQLILDSAVDGILTIDAEGTIESVNPAAERMFGYAAADLLGENVRILMPSPYHEEHDGYIARYLETGERKIIGIGREVVARRRDGTVFPIDLAVSEVQIDGKRTFMGTIRDITDRKELEEQFRQAQKMEAIGRLAGGVAHDFNTLLGSILGYSEMLLDRIEEGDPLRRPVEQIRRGAERGAGLTRQLLAFSRRQVLEPEVLDLNAVLREMDDMLRRLIGAHYELEHRLDPELGAVKVDAGQIQQVVMNLVVNACDAMSGGGGRRITVSTENVDVDEAHLDRGAVLAPGRYVRLTVRDSGCGMDEETRRRVFEPFFTTKEVGKGTGLGLSTVYGIVRQSGGGVAVESRPGEGSAFKVYLLRSEEEAAAEEVERAAPAEPERGSETVLLVEDDEMFLELLSEVLEAGGYRVLAAGDAPEALALAARHDGPIDLLVSDMVMPGMSGKELARRLARQRPRMKILLMSGYSDEALAERGVISEKGFIQKPFSTRELALKVRASLDEREAG